MPYEDAPPQLLRPPWSTVGRRGGFWCERRGYLLLCYGGMRPSVSISKVHRVFPDMRQPSQLPLIVV